ncbi:hypothetical protein ACKFKF_11325 [Phormidesmis sp. 146-12]
MKRALWSKSLRTLSLMTMLSVVVGSIVQQSAQAQNRTQPKASVDCNPQFRNGFFYDFQDIKFTPKQEATYRKIQAKGKKEAMEFMKNVQTEPMPDSPVDFAMKGVSDKDEPEITAARDKIGREIINAQTALRRGNLPPKEQLRVLTEKYGQYATFFQASRLRFTPEQIADREKRQRDFEAQMMSIFTPQQQKVYRANLVIKRQIEACDTRQVRWLDCSASSSDECLGLKRKVW